MSPLPAELGASQTELNQNSRRLAIGQREMARQIVIGWNDQYMSHPDFEDEIYDVADLTLEGYIATQNESQQLELFPVIRTRLLQDNLSRESLTLCVDKSLQGYQLVTEESRRPQLIGDSKGVFCVTPANHKELQEVLETRRIALISVPNDNYQSDPNHVVAELARILGVKEGTVPDTIVKGLQNAGLTAQAEFLQEYLQRKTNQE